MIALPLHGQDTAAVENSLGRQYPLCLEKQGAMFLVNRRGLFCRVPSLYLWLGVPPELVSTVG